MKLPDNCKSTYKDPKTHSKELKWALDQFERKTAMAGHPAGIYLYESIPFMNQNWCLENKFTWYETKGNDEPPKDINESLSYSGGTLYGVHASLLCCPLILIELINRPANYPTVYNSS
ncbi:32117_t:CDS:2 [Gigaspora margarita]|uniref:32117_t:CDS:1 n=1 Tax=Gigaspora margarita TaxID=4874 RepID=A0ABN7UV73_GIGMA|nr:32117_t:CDS:2 [Gigaspora margarita]